MDATEESYRLAVHELTVAFTRLGKVKTTEEALLIAQTVGLATLGAPKPPSSAHASTSQPRAASSTPSPSLSKAAKRELRRTPEAREAARVKRAAYFRAQANSLDPENASRDNTSPRSDLDKAPAPANNPPPPPRTPEKVVAPSVLAHLQSDAPASKELGKRGSTDRSPQIHQFNSPSTAPSQSKRTNGPSKKLTFTPSDPAPPHYASLEHARNHRLQCAREAVMSFVETSKRWRALHDEEPSVRDSIVSDMAEELLAVSKHAWDKHMEREMLRVFEKVYFAQNVAGMHSQWQP